MTEYLLGEVVDFIGGGTPDKSKAEFWNGDIPWASVKDFKSTALIVTKDKISNVGLNSSASNLIPAGSVLIPTRMAVGKAAINSIPVAINQDIKALKPRIDIDNTYLLYLMLSKSAILKRQATGATVKGIRLENLRSLKVNIPPLKEQKRIAAILDQAEELKQKRQRTLDLLDELKQSIFIDMFGDPDTNPHNFQRKKLGEIINFVGGSQPSKANFVYEHNEGLVRLVQIRDFKSDKNIVYVPAHLAKRPFSTEDIMIGRYGPPVFQILRGLSGTYNVALMKAEPIGDISKEFIYYLLKEPRLHNFVVANSERTAGQSGVNLKLLNEYPAYLPPKDVQTKFDAKIANVSKLEESIIQSSHLSEELFTSLQHKAFSGELSGTA